MNNKLIHIGLIGRTNAGKSTLINALVGEKISIENKKINTTLEAVIGICNIKNTQMIFYDTPGINFLKTTNILKKKIKIQIWETLNKVDLLLFIVDVFKFNHLEVIKDLKKIIEIKKPILIIFNKTDLIKNEVILSYIDKLDKEELISDFFNVSAKYLKGIDQLLKYLISKSITKRWKYINNEITNKDNIFITNECTRNAILTYLHHEVPYNISIKNLKFKILKNQHIKIKQKIEITNYRYKSIILGKQGTTIKKIRENSQKEIEKIFNKTTHLYLEVNYINVQ